MIYGNIIKELREKANLTQQEVAAILKINRSAYSVFEIENTLMPIIHLNTLSNYFNVSLDYIFNFTNTPNYPNSKNNIDKIMSSIRLKEFRKEHKLTQDKLAQQLSTLHQTISSYEKGKQIIATPFLYDICKKYRISADYLLGRIDEPKYLK